MEWKIDKWVTRGEWDNRQRDRVFIRLWLAGRKEPVHVELTGNGRRDLAGCLLTFRRRDEAAKARPSPGRSAFAPTQDGVAGDMTASRRVWEPSVTEEEWDDWLDLGLDPPEALANCLHLEWYNQAGERVLLESPHFELRISEHAWALTAEEDRRQRAASEELYQAFLRREDGADPG